MSHSFKYKPLRHLTTKVGSGATPKGGKDSYHDTGISLIRSLNVYDYVFKLNNLAFINENQAHKLKNVVVEENDILLNITGASVCRCTIVPKDILPARVNQHVSIIRVNPKELIPQFALHAINSSSLKKGLFNLAMTGATREALTKNDILDYKLPVPPILTQKKIAAILSAYDDLIENNKHRIALLENMAEEIYREWFVRFRFPGYKTAEFDKGIPKGWEIKKINDIYKTASGGTPSRKNNNNYDGDINWLKTGELKNKFVFESVEKITIQGLESSSAKVFPAETVVIAMYCAMPDITILAEPSATNQACCAFLPREQYISYIYTYYLIKFSQIHMIQYAHGAAQQNLSQDLIKGFNLLLADKESIRKFGKTITPIFEEIKILMQVNENLIKTKESLLPRLISGKLSVEDLDIQFPPSMQKESSA
jgi:type I restriction enzyme S subunit